MKRRDFLGGMGLAAAGSLIISNSANARTNQRIEFAKGPTDRPLEVEIAVKPALCPLIHSDVWEGPCRPSAGNKPQKERAADDLAARWSLAYGKTPEQERADAQEGVKQFAESLKANLSPDFRLLDPILMEYSEDFWIGPEQMAKLEPDRDKADVYLVSGMSYPATIIAETFKKPVVMRESMLAMDAVAYMKAKGLEGHAFSDFQDLNQLLSLLRTRKVFQQTNILIITDRGLPPYPVRSCMDVSMLKDKFGIGSHFVSYREFASEMDEVIEDQEWGAKAEDRAEQLIKNAEETHIEKQYVKRSFEFYYAIKNLMQKYGCNAFTVECFELCASRVADKYEITPCLVHTLLKDEGVASACEADLNALLAMRLLMSAANKSSFMGNPIVLSKDQLVVNHSVPGIKMAGYENPDLPYHLRHFVESGWGTKVMIDFTKLEEKTVTLARLDPLGTKIYLAKGEIVGCSGFNKGTLIGCSLAAHIRVPDAPECLRKLSDFGTHLSMVYGDYSREIQGLADMMGLEVVYAT
jgi:L-fucose isomerase-like protein